jgi:inosine-uridine nucleoside N-ribohydrolase
MTSNSGKIDCWLDCDPGIDDAFALILSAYSPKINLIGVSTVSGNSSIKYMTRNTLKILNVIGFINSQVSNDFTINQELDLINCVKYGGMRIPVIEGSGRPFLGKPVKSEFMLVKKVILDESVFL